MSINALSMPGSNFARCSISPGGLDFKFDPHMTPEMLEKCLHQYTPSKLASLLTNGETLLSELLRRALCAAADVGNQILIEYIVRKWGPYSLNMGDALGRPALYYAMDSNRRDLTGSSTALMIQLGAKVNVIIGKNLFGQQETLLETACRYTDDKSSLFLQLLLKNNARIQVPLHLKTKSLSRLSLAQTQLTLKMEVTKKRTDMVQNVLMGWFPIVLIQLINELEEEPIFADPIQPAIASSESVSSN
jgi:hypothetical protein